METWDKETAAGQPMGNPIPEDLRKGIPDDMMLKIAQDHATLDAKIVTLSRATGDADKALEVYGSAMTMIQSVVDAVLPVIKTALANKAAPPSPGFLSHITGTLTQVNQLASTVNTIKSFLPV